jgi:hypothetical protein
MVEIFFGIITRQAIRRGSSRSVKDLIAAIETFIDGWNEHCCHSSRPKPPTTSSPKPPVRRLQTRNTRLGDVMAVFFSFAVDKRLAPSCLPFGFAGQGRRHHHRRRDIPGDLRVSEIGDTARQHR